MVTQLSDEDVSGWRDDDQRLRVSEVFTPHPPSCLWSGFFLCQLWPRRACLLSTQEKELNGEVNSVRRASREAFR